MKKILSVLLAVLLIASVMPMGAFKLTVNAETEDYAYDTVYDYSDINATIEEITDSNKGKFGIYAVNTDNAHKLYLPVGGGNAYDGGIGGGYGDLCTAWGTKNAPYVIYKVKEGTKFEFTVRTFSDSGLAGYESMVNESLATAIEASANGTDGWKNKVDTKDSSRALSTAGPYVDITITYDVPADCNYVKITLPLKGIIPGTTYRGNDMARIMGVKYFKYVTPAIQYDTVYDYSDNTVEQVPVNGGNISNYGIYSYNNSTKAPALLINESIGNEWRGGIAPGYGGLGMPWGELENAYVVYEVKSGTFFEATIRMIGDGSKNNFANATGEPFEVSVEASTNDMNGWKNKVDTSTASKVAAGPYVDYTITYEVPADCTFVKVTFPQKGIIPGTSARASDAARLMKVRLNAAKNFYEGTDTVMNYKANGAVDFFYDNDAALIYLYKQNGVVIENFSNGAAYVAPSMAYLNSGANIAKPYVVYAVESGTKFVAAINVNRVAAAAMDAGFVVKLYESANGTSWTEAATQVESVGDIDYFTFTTATTAKYVKIEFPHTDAVKNIDKVNEIFGLMAVAFNPNEKDYEIENPYGDYEFEATYDFYRDPCPESFNPSDFGIYELTVPGALGFEAASTKPAYYLAHTYARLINKENLEKAGMVYSVKPGTAFQVVALLSRNGGFIQMIEKKLGYNWDIMLEVSSDGKTWSSYNPSRILTDEYLMEGTPAHYVTEIITIPSIPADVKFVKVIYPQTGAMNLVTDGTYPYVGNDLIGIAQVSHTPFKHTMAPPAAPKVENFNDTSVTLKFTDGYEYCIDGINWQKSNVFTGLKPNTTYTFYQRIFETDTAYASGNSEGTTVTTLKYPVLTPDAPAFVVESVTGRMGDTVTVAVKTRNNPGIAGLKLYIGYDSNVLEFLGGSEADFKNGLFSTSPVENNPISIVWTATDLMAEDGTIALLTFRIKNDAAIGNTEITISYDRNDIYGEDTNEKVAFAVENGFVNVISYISGDVNNDNKVNMEDLALLLRFVSDWDVQINELAADVDRDGTVDIVDLTILLRYLSDWDVELK